MELNSVFFPHSIQSCWYSFVCSAKLSFSSPILLGLGIFFYIDLIRKTGASSSRPCWVSDEPARHGARCRGARSALPKRQASPAASPHRYTPPVPSAAAISLRAQPFLRGAPLRWLPSAGRPSPYGSGPVPSPPRGDAPPAPATAGTHGGPEGRGGGKRPLSALRGAFRFPRWEVAGAGRRGGGPRCVRRPGKRWEPRCVKPFLVKPLCLISI